MNARPLASGASRHFWGALIFLFPLSFCFLLFATEPGALFASASTPSNAPGPTALSVLESVSLRARTTSWSFCNTGIVRMPNRS